MLATLFKITGVFLLFFVAKALARRGIQPWRSRRLLQFGVMTLLLVTFLLGPILKAYLSIWTVRFMAERSHFFSFWVMNFVCISLPSQIIPHLAFLLPDHESSPVVLSGSVHPFLTLAVLGFGATISAIIGLGMWKARTRFQAECWYFLAGVPIYLPITTSTLRYLSYSQIFVIMFFLLGLGSLFHDVWNRLSVRGRTPTFLFPGVAAVLGLTFLVRLGGVSSNHGVGIRAYLGSFWEIAPIYRGLDHYLANLPADSTRILLTDPDQSRWNAVRGVEYDVPDPDPAGQGSAFQCDTGPGCEHPVAPAARTTPSHQFHRPRNLRSVPRLGMLCHGQRFRAHLGFSREQR